MILTEDSPFRRLPANHDPRQVAVLDGLRYSIDMLDLAYEELRDVLARIHNSFETGGESNGFPISHLLCTSAFSKAWLIVDAAERLRKLLNLLPRGRNEPTFGMFFAATTVIKELRNSIQHLDRSIGAIAASRTSTWGELDWAFMIGPDGPGTIDILGSMAMHIEAQELRKHRFDPPPPGMFRGPVDNVSLTAHGHRVSLSVIHRHVTVVASAVEESLKRLALLPSPQSDHFLSLILGFSDSNNSAGSIGASASGPLAVSIELVKE